MRKLNPRSKKSSTPSITLTERHLIRKNDPLYKELDELTFKAKNLYNATLYAMRQHFFVRGFFPSYQTVNKAFTHGNQPDYRSLPAKVSKHVQMEVEEACKSFTELQKLYSEGELENRPALPRYLHKTRGRQTLHYERGAISKPSLKKGIIHLSRTNICIPTCVEPSSVQFVRVVPKPMAVVVEVGYKKELPALPKESGRIAALDLGVNNLALCSSNVMTPILVDGRYLKSVNQRANKAIARTVSDEEKRNGKKSSRRIQAMWQRRKNRISDYLHKASRYLVNQFVSNQIDTVIIGHNPGWKQDTNMGKRNNQNFCQIPYNELIDMISYKCRLAGIRVIVTEESHTSKCSFLDNEECCHHDHYMGRRIKRGLFRCSDGRKINADLNGSLNILKKGMLSVDRWTDELYRECVEMNEKTSPVRYLVPRAG